MSSTNFRKRGTRAASAEPNVRSVRSTITTNDSVVDEGDFPKNLRAFRAAVWSHYKKQGRHDLPWRKNITPYKVLVSEVMLQQTQVPRVIEKYKEFLTAFPNIRMLAKAPLSEVLKVWSGMGYNRRAKYLHDAAQMIVSEYRGNFKEALHHALPGVGPYTKSAVRVFAFDEPDVLVETNVRTAITRHFFQDKENIKDDAVREIAVLAARGQDPRAWQSALFDYGAHLKRTGVRNNIQSAHYTKQSKFEGSLRQVRGAILRELYQGPTLVKGLPFEKGKIEKALEGLARDGLIKKTKRKWRLA